MVSAGAALLGSLCSLIILQGLVLMVTGQGSKRMNRGKLSLFRSRLGTGTPSLLLHSMDQNKLQGQIRFRRENGL